MRLRYEHPRCMRCGLTSVLEYVRGAVVAYVRFYRVLFTLRTFNKGKSLKSNHDDKGKGKPDA